MSFVAPLSEYVAFFMVTDEEINETREGLKKEVAKNSLLLGKVSSLENSIVKLKQQEKSTKRQMAKLKEKKEELKKELEYVNGSKDVLQKLVRDLEGEKSTFSIEICKLHYGLLGFWNGG